MAKPKNTNKDAAEVALREDVQRWVDNFRRRNDGVEPTRKQVAEGMGRRKADICRTMNWLDDAEARERAALGALPDIPDVLVKEGSSLVEKLWILASEVSAPVISELRRALSNQAGLHARQRSEDADLLSEMEDERDAECARADAAEAERDALQAELTCLSAELDQAHAQLEDRAAFLALLTGGRGLDTDAEEKGDAIAERTCAESETPSGFADTGPLPLEFSK